MTLLEIGSIAGYIGLFISLFLTVKIYQLNIKIGKMSIDNSHDNQENRSGFSLFTSQKNEKKD